MMFLTWNELPEKDVFATVAKETNTDYVIAMEISNLIKTRHMSFFSTKAEIKAKLKYNFYNTKDVIFCNNCLTVVAVAFNTANFIDLL